MRPPEPTLAVILVNYNGLRWLQGCLDGLMRQSMTDHEVVVVDNASSDGSVAFIQERFPEVRVIQAPGNIGFGAGNNLGVERTTAPELLFLNTDTLVEPDFLARMLEARQRGAGHILAPRVVNFDRQDHYQGRFLSIDRYGYLGWGTRPFYVEGSALMISRADYLRLGGFDPRYFMYSEDIDLCWRAHLMGLTVAIVEDVVICHHCGGSSTATSLLEGEKKVYTVPRLRRFETEKNNLRNLLKNDALSSLVWVVPVSFGIALAEALFYVLTGHAQVGGDVLRAWQWNLLHLKETWQERRQIQSRRVVSHGEIHRLMTGAFPNKLQALLIVGLPRFK